MRALAFATTPARVPDPRAGMRFVLVVGAFGLLTNLLYRFGAGLWQALAPLDVATARLAAALIRWTGMEAEQVGAVVAHPGGFAFEIYYRCTGLVPVLFLLVGLLALPGRPRTKIWPALGGGITLMALNLFRLVTLFEIGVRHPQAFQVMHAWVWETAMILAILLLWLLWLEWLRLVPRESGCRNA